MFDRFSAEAREAIVAAQDTAREHGADRIGTVHLRAVLRGDDLGPPVDAHDAFGRLGLAQAHEALQAREAGREPSPIPFDAEVKRCLTQALELAGTGVVGTGHLLEALG